MSNEDGQMPDKPISGKATGYITLHFEPEKIELRADGKYYLPVVVETGHVDKVDIHHQEICIDEVVNADGK